MKPHKPPYLLGEDFILRYSALGRRYYKAYAMTYMECFTLHQDHFYNILSQMQFIEAATEVRARVGKLLVLRWVLAMNARLKVEECTLMPTMALKFEHVQRSYPLGVRILKLIRADYMMKRTNAISNRNNAIYQEFFPPDSIVDASDERDQRRQKDSWKTRSTKILQKIGDNVDQKTKKTRRTEKEGTYPANSL
jgi:hypothetical protein